AVAQGAHTFPQDQVVIRRVPDLEPDDLIRKDARWWSTREALASLYKPPDPGDLRWADAVILGSPGYFGSMAAALQSLLQQTAHPWRLDEVEEKAGAAFCTTSTIHGGNEAVVLNMLTALMHLGFVITPAGYL